MDQQYFDRRQKHFDNLALKPPGLTILTDHPLTPERFSDDYFNLSYKLGPVYDILRHPKTQTPLAIAIYGDWGSGKTSAMKWLEGIILQWNKKGNDPNKQKIKLKPVWFYPWKYHTKPDVWRGLVSEVIINCLDIKNTDLASLKKASKILALCLGKSALDIFSTIKIGIPGLELNGKQLKTILKNLKDATHPERQYLNEYEKAFHNWVKDSLGNDKRMVIFIDDLDRCLPEVALQVLEALKLYLNIDKLIFVLGVDDKIINKLVENHYKDLGLDKEKSTNYLAKMFQIEVSLFPNEQQIEDYLDQQLKTIDIWKNKLSDDEKEIFRSVIFNLAGQNPREVKRLINSALMDGGGSISMFHSDDQPSIEFKQGLQFFFVRKILRDRFTMESLITRKLGDNFFAQWSEIIRKNIDKPNFSLTLIIPEDVAQILIEPVHKKTLSSQHLGKPTERSYREIPNLNFAPSPYHDFLKNPVFPHLFHLLADKDLAQLMRIEYPHTASRIAAPVTPPTKNEVFIREAIARHLKKTPEDLVEQDYSNLTELSLSHIEISNLESLRTLNNLRELSLWHTNVNNIIPLQYLTKLHTLSLSETKIIDIEPLQSLIKLRILDLSITQVNNIEPLNNLQELQFLHLFCTQVRNLEPLKDLSNLQELWFVGTNVSSLEHLRSLTNLQRLFFSKTQVSNLEPIKSLTNLQSLHLGNTNITNIKFLKGLINLQNLAVDGTQINNLDPIMGLTNLHLLYLSDTPIENIKSLQYLKNLELLYIINTPVSNLEPLKNLTKLGDLRFSNTKVVDLEPLKNLTNLDTLEFNNTQVSNLKPLHGLAKLKFLIIENTPVPKEQVAALKKALPNLYIKC